MERVLRIIRPVPKHDILILNLTITRPGAFLDVLLRPAYPRRSLRLFRRLPVNRLPPPLLAALVEHVAGVGRRIGVGSLCRLRGLLSEGGLRGGAEGVAGWRLCGGRFGLGGLRGVGRHCVVLVLKVLHRLLVVGVKDKVVYCGSGVPLFIWGSGIVQDAEYVTNDAHDVKMPVHTRPMIAYKGNPGQPRIKQPEC